MRDKRQQHLDEGMTITDYQTKLANNVSKKPNYPEERAYYNRIKLITKKDITDTELAALKRIAVNGLDARERLDKAIAKFIAELYEAKPNSERAIILNETVRNLKRARGENV